MMRTGLVTVIFLALLLVGCVVYPGIGARFIAPQTVLQAFLHFDPQNFDHNVIVRLRLPRLAAALLTGASLGVAGALLQAVIRNPLGEPHILGLNAGAALAVVAASALGLAFPVGRPLLAMRTWLAGDLAGQDWATLGTSAWFSLGGFVLALYLAPSLNMLALGDRMAQGLGVSVLRTRTFTLLAIALLCGAAVSIAGPIGFVGLLVPQIVRRLVSADLRVLLPLSACVGALLLLLADIIARTLFTPHELATGVMTALVGAPVFVIMATRMFK
ncbi:TPA: iron ABC transporter permease [Escherichia coli O25b:H4-ST131]|nr:iron ABC transporter permease [Escherichia coli O25b:H4-ST131]